MTEREHLLTILAEECAEVAQRASKALRFGDDEIQPGQQLTNLERIIDEVIDVVAVLSMLGIETYEFSITGVLRKKAKVRKYLDYAEQCGTLQR